ncbi:unnamed protein product [Caenorhabditis auriculariae]|uniref:Receptor expression-enhancing protein n=1 Tax=Caenorhabditis auriculariae TaxID=2777116 RepID=A0A8S1GPL8_9PELO|nr:unnamed protein product [Caenorhabditis auriculariae]
MYRVATQVNRRMVIGGPEIRDSYWLAHRFVLVSGRCPLELRLGAVGMSETISRLLTITVGTLYPAYRSYKAIRTKDTREYVKWMMFWIVFALYSFLENILDLLLAFWFPFYFQLKIVFVVWLLSPWTKGASILYRKWVHPMLTRHERDIDALLDSAKSESYNQLVRIGSRSLVYAKDIVAEAAIRGQQQLVNQIQRSYSANDVSTDREPLRSKMNIEEIVEEADESMHSDHELVSDDAPKNRRTTRSRSRSRTLEGGENPYPATMPRRNPRRH